MIGPIGTGMTHIRHIPHPTDFSPASMAAFGHALKRGRDRLDYHFCRFDKAVTCTEKFSMILVTSPSPSSR